MHQASGPGPLPRAAVVSLALLYFASPGAVAATAPLVFSDFTAGTGISYSGPSWSAAWGDQDGDLLPDLFVNNHGQPHNLFLNRGNGRFAEIESTKFTRGVSDAHGAAWADFDNDGDQDLFELVGANHGQELKTNHLYVNDGGVMRDRAAARGVDDPYGRGRRPLWFDWDRDGWLDVLALNAVRRNAPSVLYRNNAGYFADSGALEPLGYTKFPLLGSLAYGKLHVVVSGQPFPYRVYDANQQGSLSLSNVRAELGVPWQYDRVMDAALFDANRDGVDDVLEVKGVLPSDAMILDGRLLAHVDANASVVRGFDFAATGTVEVMVTPRGTTWWQPSNVYIGSKGVHPAWIPFKLSPSDPAVLGLASPQGGKGVYVGYDRSRGKWQLRVVVNSYQEANFEIKAAEVRGLATVGFKTFTPFSRPSLIRSTAGRFVDATADAGFGATPASNCFSVVTADFDNDGDEDAFAACSGPLARQGVANQLYRNDGAGRFALVSAAGGVGRPALGVADGVATADFDLDGFLDLVLTNGQGLWPFSVGPTQVFRNASRQAGNTNHWLQVDLRGTRSNRDGVGTRVIVTAGGAKQRRIQRNGVHNGAQDHTRLHFGVGASTSVQSVEVLWPSGTRQVEYGLPVDQVVRIVEGTRWSLPYTVAPAGQWYGSVALARSATRSFTVTNVRSTSLPISRVRTVGIDAGQFPVTRACGASLAPGASCTVEVAFKPTRTGVRTARLMIVAGDKIVRLATLSGTGV